MSCSYCCPLLPVIGTSISGARLWIRLGPLSFQPSELCQDRAHDLLRRVPPCANAGTGDRPSTHPRAGHSTRARDFGPLLVAWLVALIVLAFQRDPGTALMFFGVFVILLYVSTQRRSWLIIGAGLFALAAVLGYLAFGRPSSGC